MQKVTDGYSGSACGGEGRSTCLKKRKLRFICCLLTALAVFLAAAVTVWAVGKEVDELQIDSLSETAEVKIVSCLLFTYPDL